VKTLHVYILKELAAPTIVSAFFFTLLLLVMRLFDEAALLLGAGVSLPVLGRLLVILIGTLLTMTVPMALLLGILIGVGRLAAENEVLAIRAAGLSVTRSFTPVIVMGGVLSAALLWANQGPIPRLFQRIDDIRYDIQFDLLTNLKPGIFYSELGTKDRELTLYYEQRTTPLEGQDQAGRLEMRRVSMRMEARRGSFYPGQNPADEREAEKLAEQLDILVTADRGLIVGDPELQQLRATLYDGTIMPMQNVGTSQAIRVRFSSLDYVIEGGDEDAQEVREVSPPEMTTPALFRRLMDQPEEPRYREGGAGARLTGPWKRHFSARNELLQRFSLPLACLAFAMIAVPLGIEVRPRAKSLSFLIATGLMTVYYAWFLIASEYSAGGAAWPLAFLALLSPNVVIGGVGLWLFRRAGRR